MDAANAAVSVVPDVVGFAPVARTALKVRLAGVAGNAIKAVVTDAAWSGAAHRNCAVTCWVIR